LTKWLGIPLLFFSFAGLAYARDHVILVIEENRSYSSVYPTGMPWLSQMGDKYSIATNYYSDEPGSLLDYLWLSSGSGEHVFGCTGGGCSKVITDDNIFREINKAGLSWKLYAESLPYAGYMGSSYGRYVKRHNPAAWYSDIVRSSTQQKRMVPFTQFAKDVNAKALPDYSIIVPNLDHDAHSGTMAAADTWLKQNLAGVLSSSYFASGGNGVLFVTFDNANGDAQGQVFTTLIGPSVARKVKNGTHFRHENTLRTIIKLLGLSVYPGASSSVSSMISAFF
jgi:phosphatidylinositol-3-phosphatase